MIATGAGLGGNISNLVVVNDNISYALVTVPGDHDALVSFDPKTGARLGEHATSNAPWTFFHLIADGNGNLLVADRNSTRPGIQVFDASDGGRVVEDTIATPLPPSTMCVVRE
jgi:hypothetical protein